MRPREVQWGELYQALKEEITEISYNFKMKVEKVLSNLLYEDGITLISK